MSTARRECVSMVANALNVPHDGIHGGWLASPRDPVWRLMIGLNSHVGRVDWVVRAGEMRKR